jgi:Tfp pilus assembly protein PilF
MAKIQLMSMDVSRIEYDKNDKKDKSSGNTKVDQRAIDLNAESLKKHKQRLAKQKIEEAIPIDITDKFNNI